MRVSWTSNLHVRVTLDRSRQADKEGISDPVESSTAAKVKPHSFGTRDKVIDLRVL